MKVRGRIKLKEENKIKVRGKTSKLVIMDEAWNNKKPQYGYHKKKIPKGTLGELSKIQEELLELEDSLDQGNKIMALVELADLYGSIKLFLEKHHPEIKMEDLKIMSEATERSFILGHRTSKK